MNRQILTLFSVLCLSVTASGRTLSLDSCRAMALRSNKQMSIARVKHEAAVNARKMARTKYLPHVDLAGGYMYSSREVSLLNDDQKYKLSNLGTLSMSKLNSIGSNVAAAFNGRIDQKLTGLVQQGLMTPDEAQRAGNLIQTIRSCKPFRRENSRGFPYQHPPYHHGIRLADAAYLYGRCYHCRQQDGRHCRARCRDKYRSKGT